MNRVHVKTKRRRQCEDYTHCTAWLVMEREEYTFTKRFQRGGEMHGGFNVSHMLVAESPERKNLNCGYAEDRNRSCRCAG